MCTGGGAAFCPVVRVVRGYEPVGLPVLLWGQVGRGLAAVHDLPSSYSFTPLIVLLLLNASRNKHNLKN